MRNKLPFLSTHTSLLLFILLMSFGLRWYMAQDRYLHAWDERYHALVAQHLMAHPLTPTLFEYTPEPYDYKDWTANHIWLSKPPLPLWGMALSMKIFGMSEWALRFPAVIYATLCCLLIYAIGKKMYGEKAAALGAALFAIHGVITDLVAGRVSSDGVEICFLFWSFLASYFVFRKKPLAAGYSDFILCGVCSGLAFLSKWQVALLMPLLMFIYHFQTKHLWLFIKQFGLCILAFLIVSSSWLIYTHFTFPLETSWLLTSLWTPIYSSGNTDYVSALGFQQSFGNFFGYSTYILLIWFLVQLLRERKREEIVLFIWALLPLIIFSVSTYKRGTWLMVSAPAIFLIIGKFLFRPLEKKMWHNYTLRGLSILSSLLILGYSVERLYVLDPKPTHMPWCDALKAKTYTPGSTIYNEEHYIEAMFYHDVIAYPGPPSGSVNSKLP